MTAMIGSARAPGILDRRLVVEPIAASNLVEPDSLRLLMRQHMAACVPLDFHHVPGRLRLKSDALKKDAAKLEAVCDALHALPGVRSVTPNRLIGSFLVDYDPLVLSPHEVSTALRECCPAVGDDTGTGLPCWVERVAGKAIESLVEKLAVVLIASVV